MTTTHREQLTTPTVGFGEEPHHEIDERPGVADPATPREGLAPPPAVGEKIDTTPLRQRFTDKKS